MATLNLFFGTSYVTVVYNNEQLTKSILPLPRNPAELSAFLSGILILTDQGSDEDVKVWDQPVFYFHTKFSEQQGPTQETITQLCISYKGAPFYVHLEDGRIGIETVTESVVTILDGSGVQIYSTVQEPPKEKVTLRRNKEGEIIENEETVTVTVGDRSSTYVLRNLRDVSSIVQYITEGELRLPRTVVSRISVIGIQYATIYVNECQLRTPKVLMESSPQRWLVTILKTYLAYLGYEVVEG